MVHRALEDGDEDGRVDFVEPDVAVVSDRRGHVRRLVFRPGDRSEDEYRAIGLVLAAFSSEPVPPDDTLPITPRFPRPRAWVQLAGLWGRGLSPGPDRFGGFLGAAYRFGDGPWFSSLSVEYAVVDSSTLSIHTTFLPVTASGGAEFRFDRVNLFLRPAVGLTFERLAARVTDPAKNESASDARLLPGCAFSVEIGFLASSRVHIVLAGANRFLTGGTAVRVRGERVASLPAEAYSLRLGLELSVFP